MNYGTEKEYEVIAYFLRTGKKRKNSKSIRKQSKSFSNSKSPNPDCVTRSAVSHMAFGDIM